MENLAMFSVWRPMEGQDVSPILNIVGATRNKQSRQKHAWQQQALFDQFRWEMMLAWPTSGSWRAPCSNLPMFVNLWRSDICPHHSRTYWLARNHFCVACFRAFCTFGDLAYMQNCWLYSYSIFREEVPTIWHAWEHTLHERCLQGPAIPIWRIMGTWGNLLCPSLSYLYKAS